MTGYAGGKFTGHYRRLCNTIPASQASARLDPGLAPSFALNPGSIRPFRRPSTRSSTRNIAHLATLPHRPIVRRNHTSPNRSCHRCAPNSKPQPDPPSFPAAKFPTVIRRTPTRTPPPSGPAGPASVHRNRKRRSRDSRAERRWNCPPALVSINVQWTKRSARAVPARALPVPAGPVALPSVRRPSCWLPRHSEIACRL